MEADENNAQEDENAEQQMLIDQEEDKEKVTKEFEQDENDNIKNVEENSEQHAQELKVDLEKMTLDDMVQSIKSDSSINAQALMLSERLKILLEPTLNSGLIGDFRSGKRLNLKKIVPFVASGYRKDKIWLRRAKPQKRTYRLLLAIDNSYSIQNQPETAM